MNKNDIFIDKANKIHNFKYSYNKVNYIVSNKSIVITCHTHGDFEQRPDNHLMGKGCGCCGKNKRIDNESFIKKSSTIHGGRYDYSLVDIKNSTKKVKIICSKHGIFEQSPTKHYSGSGCPACGGSIKSNPFDFITKSNIIHNNRYDYSLLNYLNNKTKVKIICLEHGEFNILPSNHLKGIGCSKCSGKYMDRTYFIEKSNKIHNYKYIYDNVIYINHKTNVEILCPQHGAFKTTPSSHANSRSASGCRICKKSTSMGEVYIEEYLKSNKIKYKKQFSFSELKFKKELRFDFAIFDDDDRLNFLIEYNGEQHYKFRGQFGMSLYDFESSIERDNKKKEYCLMSNINMHIIRYDDNIDVALSKIFI